MLTTEWKNAQWAVDDQELTGAQGRYWTGYFANIGLGVALREPTDPNNKYELCAGVLKPYHAIILCIH